MIGYRCKIPAIATRVTYSIHLRIVYQFTIIIRIDLIHKSQNAPVPYPTMQHSEQKCAHFCSEWSIMGYGTSSFWDLWIRSIQWLLHKSQNAPVPYPTMQHSEQKCAHFCSEWSIVGYGTGSFWDLWNWSIAMTWEGRLVSAKEVQPGWQDDIPN